MSLINPQVKYSDLERAVEYLQARPMGDGNYMCWDDSVYRWVKNITPKQLEKLGRLLDNHRLRVENEEDWSDWCQSSGDVDWKASNHEDPDDVSDEESDEE